MTWFALAEGLNFFLSGNEDLNNSVLFENEEFLALKRDAEALKRTVEKTDETAVASGCAYFGIRYRGEKIFLSTRNDSALSETEKQAVNDLATRFEAFLVAQFASVISRNGLGHVVCRWR